MSDERPEQYKRNLGIILIIIGLFLCAYGLGWLIMGAVILGFAVDDDVTTILNSIKVHSLELGYTIIVLSAMFIIIGGLTVLYVVAGFVLAGFYDEKTQKSWKNKSKVYSFLGIVLLSSTIVVLALWTDIERKIQTDDSKDQMVNNLHKEFTEDGISSADTISKSWNKIFMKLDCCAVNPVVSTTNDFDMTPWCTTSGECQQTNSQIPKTCCNRATESTYSSALSSCHANVESGTYNSKGCYEILKNRISLYHIPVIIFGVVLLNFEILVIFFVVLYRFDVLILIEQHVRKLKCSSCKDRHTGHSEGNTST